MSIAPWRNEKIESEATINERRIEKMLTWKELCDAANVSIIEAVNLNNGNSSPVYKRKHDSGRPRPSAVRLATVLGCEVYELFPRYFCDIQRFGHTHENSVEDIYGVPKYSESAEDIYANKEAVEAAMRGLNERSKAAVFLNICEEETLDSVGAVLRVSRERARQIVAKALRRMRHPSRW